MPFQHGLVAGSAGEDGLAGSAGSWEDGRHFGVSQLTSGAGEEWEGRGGKGSLISQSWLPAFFFAFTTLPAPNVQSREATHPLPETMRRFYTVKPW